MSNDRYNPRRIEDDAVSLINEPIGPIADDVVVLGCVRREPPLRAAMLNALSHTQVLLGHLERGVPASTPRQRLVVRELYERSQAQLEALSAAVDVLATDR
jgi:hypothetical protein